MSIRDFLTSREVWFETLLHCPAPSASRRAQTAHVPGRQVAKGVLVRAGGGYVLAVLPSTTRIDTERLSEALGGLPVALATEDEVEQVFGDCERGALPPFGRLYGVRTVVDASLAAGAEIVCVGNTRHEGLRLRYQDYEAVESPFRAHFATAAGPDRPRPTHRRAG
jgi:Ala-tRNA(Pro) deacylase